ncbi:CPBP family intramembrane glutamic endopeptidase [Vibrio rhodolitus]|uniref:CPBP family intramembrane glutamic endopeptidase n=1 Tax=Vibrio rhodolitus TaxID=2231649 RepID=UPI000E0A2D26|nr:type II CAAX endopeptidase family protein [Vibrio rhodolitus]
MPLYHDYLIWLGLGIAICFAFNNEKNLSLIALGCSLIVAILLERLTTISALSLGAAFLVTWRLTRLPQRYNIVAHAFIILLCVALFTHSVPGIQNFLVLDQVTSGPQSTSFSMYLNLDKPLVFFILLLFYPSLLGKRGQIHFQAITYTSCYLFSLLFIAVFLGALRFELSFPSWWWLFIFNNLFFTCVAEESLFRGYLQQLLCDKWGINAGIGIAATLFGLAHISGGLLLVIFATLAGIGYGLIFHWTQRLWAVIFAHFTFNFIHLVFFTYPLTLN